MKQIFFTIVVIPEDSINFLPSKEIEIRNNLAKFLGIGLE